MFLPRSLQIKTKDEWSTGGNEDSNDPAFAKPKGEEPPKSPGQDSEKRSEVIVKSEDAESGSEEEPVLSYSKLQRWPEPGEPVCAVCGRYGAYIVDKTDRDVCSLECKARHLMKLGIPLYPSGETTCPLPASSEDVESSGWSYREHPEVAGLTVEQINGLRRKVCAQLGMEGMVGDSGSCSIQMTIKTEGKNVPKAISHLRHLNLPQQCTTTH